MKTIGSKQDDSFTYSAETTSQFLSFIGNKRSKPVLHVVKSEIFPRI